MHVKMLSWCRSRRTLGVVAVLVVLYGGFRLTLHWKIAAQLEAFRAEGYPVTLTELDQCYPQVPASNNAAEVYLPAFAKIVRWKTNTMEVLAPQPSPRRAPTSNSTKNSLSNQTPAQVLVPTSVLKRSRLPIAGDAKLPPPSQALSNEVHSLIAEYLATNAVSLQLLHKGGTTIKSCRYPIDLTAGFDMPLTHLDGVRCGARLLALEGILAAENGDSRVATRAIVDGFILARTLDYEPGIISQLVRLACEGIALIDLERALNRAAFSDGELSQVMSTVVDAEAAQLMIRGIVGRIACIEPLFSMAAGKLVVELVCSPIIGKNEKYYFYISVIELYRVTGLMELNRLRVLQGMGDYIAACRQPLPARLHAIETCQANAQKLPPWHLFSRMLLSGLGGEEIREIKSIARLRTAEVALAIERYRLVANAIPDSLDDLVPKFLTAVPLDPFTVHPLHYKKLVSGYVVYSIGQDGIDNGGNEKLDIPFTVAR